MKLENLKDLEKLMKLCRRQGISAIEIDNIKFNLGPEPLAQTQWASRAPSVPAYTPGGVTDDTKIVTDELTDEQKLFWSANSSVDQLT